MNNHNEIVDESGRNYIEHLLVELYNEFNTNVNMNTIKFNTRFIYIYHIYINMYNNQGIMYDTISQMFNEYNNVLTNFQITPENVSPGAILERNRIKFTVIEKQNPHEYMGDCCSICLFDYNHVNDVEQEQQQEIIKTKCNHIFHLNCLSNWVNQSKTCPICRNEME
jgi:hypothetical protein